MHIYICIFLLYIVCIYKIEFWYGFWVLFIVLVYAFYDILGV